MSAWDTLGGEDKVRAIVRALVARMAGDFVIGFLFEGRDHERIARHELELASAHLGGPRAYEGRPLGDVHQPLKINLGHFRRRLSLLSLVLEEHGVPADIARAWIAREAALQDVISTGVECVL
jgi:truncated hemoglobin YjbI